MKIYTEGARFWGGQIDRIDHGFTLLGHELTKNISDADLVYSNNGLYDNIVSAKKLNNIRGKVILNVLDLAPHLYDFPMQKTREQLSIADAVTCISKTVQRDLKIRGGFDSTVIYNPMKPVFSCPSDIVYKALFVGRVNDPEKRTILGSSALRLLGIQSNQVITTGGEPPNYGGCYLGPTSDIQLNVLYNSSIFLICPTRNAFLGLPILEASAVGCIPIFCKDLDIREEFFPNELFPEYACIDANPESIAAFMKQLVSDPYIYSSFKNRLISNFQTNIADKLDPVQVAKRILELYQTL